MTHGWQPPEKFHKRLVPRQVLAIRMQADKWRMSHPGAKRFPVGLIRAIAKAYGVSMNHIYQILRRERWKSV